jgi:uncharacterized protein (TIGR03435 family)
MKFMGITMAQFADRLSIQLHSSIIDGSGLSGKFDIALPIDVQDLQPGADSLPASLLTAVQSAGLQLKSERAPVKRLVIDKAEMVLLEN